APEPERVLRAGRDWRCVPDWAGSGVGSGLIGSDQVGSGPAFALLRPSGYGGLRRIRPARARPVIPARGRAEGWLESTRSSADPFDVLSASTPPASRPSPGGGTVPGSRRDS